MRLHGVKERLPGDVSTGKIGEAGAEKTDYRNTPPAAGQAPQDGIG
jgi:hypothetical protein